MYNKTVLLQEIDYGGELQRMSVEFALKRHLCAQVCPLAFTVALSHQIALENNE